MLFARGGRCAHAVKHPGWVHRAKGTLRCAQHDFLSYLAIKPFSGDPVGPMAFDRAGVVWNNDRGVCAAGGLYPARDLRDPVVSK